MSDHKYDIDSDVEQNFSLTSVGVEPKSVQELAVHVSVQCKRAIAYFKTRTTRQIHSVLQNVQDQFQAMSNHVGHQMEEMGSRVDELEKTIADVMTQAGMELPL